MALVVALCWAYLTAMDLRPHPWTSDESPDGAQPAATLIILRDCPEGAPPEMLMVERSSAMRFAAGVIVFPGGRVDSGDHELAAGLDHGLALQDAASRIAAIRETIEEVGVAIGLVPHPARTTVALLRDGLQAGTGMGPLLAAHGLTIDFAALTPFSRWCPGRDEKVGLSRVFDARFYVALAPDDAHHATVDATENVRLRWASAADFLSDCEAGREVAIFPTLRNLERLATCGSINGVIHHALAHRVEMVTPWVEERDGERHLCIPDHLGYPVTAQAWPTLQRG